MATSTNCTTNSCIVGKDSDKSCERPDCEIEDNIHEPSVGDVLKDEEVHENEEDSDDTEKERDSKNVGAKKKRKKKKKINQNDAPQGASVCISNDGVGMFIPFDSKGGDKNFTDDIHRKMLNLNIMPDSTGAKSKEEAAKKTFDFWNTQPVPKLDEIVTHSSNGPIEADKKKSDLRGEPYSLPPGFKWDTLDISNDAVLRELYELLNENYVEDDDNMFRFDYSPEFLRWALKPPGWLPQWHCGVRVEKSKKLVGFISAIPARIAIHAKQRHLVEINFLCVHKKLRSKRVAPVLIREITRRVNLEGVFQAVYTAGVVLPKPVATCRYWHRSLNPKKLIDVKFSHLSRNMTLQRTVKLFKLPDQPKTKGFRAMKEEDIGVCHNLLSTYLSQDEKFSLHPEFSEDEFRHWFLTRPGIINSYVVQSEEGEVTDFCSFYSLPSTIMHHPTHKMLNAAYSFYNVATRTPLVDLVQDMLIVAKNAQYDVFNALDLMQNKEFLEKLKFGMGDGNLHYYLYNWKCPPMDADKVALVLQ